MSGCFYHSSVRSLITVRSSTGYYNLNGKVERSQKTDWEEFYSIIDLNSPDLNKLLEGWQDYYNQERPHGSLNGKTPWERWYELSSKTPFQDEVEALYDPSKERFRLQNYRDLLAVQRLLEQ